MVKVICDNCGKETDAQYNGMTIVKPLKWYSRVPRGERPLMVCSRKCINELHQKRIQQGKDSTDIILPI